MISVQGEHADARAVGPDVESYSAIYQERSSTKGQPQALSSTLKLRNVAGENSGADVARSSYNPPTDSKVPSVPLSSCPCSIVISSQ